jgi:hypothetical protein
VRLLGLRREDTGKMAGRVSGDSGEGDLKEEGHNEYTEEKAQHGRGVNE